MKTLFTGLISALALSSFGQLYSFTKTTASYNDLVNPTSLTNGATWDDPVYNIPLGFTFQFYGNDYTQITLLDEFLGSGLSFDFSSPSGVCTIFNMDADIIDRGYDLQVGDEPIGGLSPISYQTTGIPGSRICKIEWKNAGFYGDLDDNGSSTDFVNLQIWFYEGSNDIEMRYGPQNIANFASDFFGGSPLYLLTDSLNINTGAINGSSQSLEGAAANPNLVNGTDSYSNLPTVNTVPTNGSVYRFHSYVARVDEKELFAGMTLSPNPTTRFISLNIQNEPANYSYQILDLLGNIALSGTDTHSPIDIQSLNSGEYILVLSENGNPVASNKIIKQ